MVFFFSIPHKEKERKKVKYIVHKLERLLNWLDFADGEITNNDAGFLLLVFSGRSHFVLKPKTKKI